MELSNTGSQASTSGTKRPRSRSASESGQEDRPAPALRTEPAAAAPPSPPAQIPGAEPEPEDVQAQIQVPVPVQVNHDLPERRYDIDPDGDLLLAIGEEYQTATPATFRVDSRALTRPSAVFRQMLHGGFAEAQRPARARPTGIFHTQFDKVPQDELKGSRIQLIYELAITTDKYDLTHCLRPWAHLWSALRLQQVTELNNRKQPGAHNASTYVGLQKCLWIMWELGNLAEFERIIVELAWCSRSDDGSLWSPVTAHGTKAVLFNESFEPEEAFGQDHPRHAPQGGVAPPDAAPQLGRDPDPRLPRRALRHLQRRRHARRHLRSMKKYRLWPLPNRDTYAGSVYQLVAALRGVSDSLSNDQNYSQLNMKMTDLSRHVDGILREKFDNNLRPLLQPGQVEHLEARGKKTGLYRPSVGK
ncbi:hypothetical protein PG994_002463 [Apiospora phragmitis]|uniref:BTB domain-containing protein n=1 Tax=Apiospora phragmitis TaxID=2905665 RepID=A0ABR1WWF0_9PEZI